MYRVGGWVTWILWAISIIVCIVMVFVPDFISIFLAGITVGVTIAQTIDHVREKGYLSRFHNWRDD